MAQLVIDGGVSIEDRIEEAAVLFGSITARGLVDFARFCRREGYLDGYAVESSIEAGDALFIKRKVFKKLDGNGLRRWICTGEDGEWFSRRYCTSESHLSYCHMLKKKRNEITNQLVLELGFRSDRGWGITSEDEL